MIFSFHHLLAPVASAFAKATADENYKQQKQFDIFFTSPAPVAQLDRAAPF